MYPIETALDMEVKVSVPWQQWQQRSSGDLMVDFVNRIEEQHMTLPNPRREDLPVPVFRRILSISSQYSTGSSKISRDVWRPSCVPLLAHIFSEINTASRIQYGIKNLQNC
jgi:hypothetical protein